MSDSRGVDVAVVGGGPAGLAVAIGARQRGLSVRLFERQRPPIDKVCGEGIMPEGVALLRRLGVDPARLAGTRFSGVEFIEGDVHAVARFRGTRGIGVRRPVLHAALVARAEQLGVDLRWGTTVREIEADGVVVDGDTLAARWIVGADGMNSLLRRAFALEVRPADRRIGMRRHYAVAPWSDCVQVHWCAAGEAYVTPIGPDTVTVAILTRTSDPFEQALADFPALATRLHGASILNEPRWSGTAFRRTRKVVVGRVALCGDAGGSVDPVTGMGITLALEQASLLADCLVRQDLAAYDGAYRRLMPNAYAMTSFMLASGCVR